jgi:hypothetical protein
MKLHFDLITHLKKKSYKILKAVEELSKLCKYSSTFSNGLFNQFLLNFTSIYKLLPRMCDSLKITQCYDIIYSKTILLSLDIGTN